MNIQGANDQCVPVKDGMVMVSYDHCAPIRLITNCSSCAYWTTVTLWSLALGFWTVSLQLQLRGWQVIIENLLPRFHPCGIRGISYQVGGGSGGFVTCSTSMCFQCNEKMAAAEHSHETPAILFNTFPAKSVMPCLTLTSWLSMIERFLCTLHVSGNHCNWIPTSNM